MKERLRRADSLSAEYMRAEQTFLSTTLNLEQSATDKRTSALQRHLTNTIAQTAEVEAAMQRQVKPLNIGIINAQK